MSVPRRNEYRARQISRNIENSQEVARPRFDKDQAEHRSRGWVLVAVFSLLVVELVVITTAWLQVGVQVEKVKDLAAIILTPTFTLFGTIVGFYFSRGK